MIPAAIPFLCTLLPAASAQGEGQAHGLAPLVDEQDGARTGSRVPS